MPLYSLAFLDNTGHIVARRKVKAHCVSTALNQANRHLCKILKGARRAMFEPSGRMDVLDEQNRPVARVYCADALHAIS